MIYYGEFLNKEKDEGALVKKLYAEKNLELLNLLSQYQKPSDYEALKQGIYDLLQQLPDYYQSNKALPDLATFPPNNIQDAIELLERNGILTSDEGDRLRDLASKGDKRLSSAFECYQILKDFDDLTNSIWMILGKGKRPKDAPSAT